MINPATVEVAKKVAKITWKVVTVVGIPLVTDYIQGRALDARIDTRIAKAKTVEAVTEVLKKES